MQSLFEANQAEEKIKDSVLYNYIDPAKARKIGTTELKNGIFERAKKEGVNKSELLKIAKGIESKKRPGGFKIQRHISLPAALYIIKNKKKITPDIEETIIRAQKDYYYKTFPKKEKESKEIRTRLNQALQKKDDVAAKEVAFANFYRHGVYKILGAKDAKEALSLVFTDKEISSYPPEKLNSYWQRVKANIRGYKDNEIIRKAQDWRKDLENKSYEDIEKIAYQAIFDDEKSIRDIQASMTDSTKKTEAKAQKKREERRASGEVVPLLKKEEKAIQDKKKLIREKVQGWFNRGSVALDKIIDSMSKSRVSLDDIKNDPDFQALSPSAKEEAIDLFKTVSYSSTNGTISSDDLKKLLAQAGLKGQTSAGLFNKLEKRISKIKEPEKKEEIKRILKKRLPQANIKREADVMDFFRQMNEEAMDMNGDGEVTDEERIRYQFLYELRRAHLPKAIIEPDTAPERHQSKCNSCNEKLFDFWKTKCSSIDKMELKAEALRDYYRQLSKQTFTDIGYADDEYFSNKTFSVLKSGKEVKKFEKEDQAKAFIKSLIDKHIKEKPGIPSDYITKQYGMKRE